MKHILAALAALTLIFSLTAAEPVTPAVRQDAPAPKAGEQYRAAMNVHLDRASALIEGAPTDAALKAAAEQVRWAREAQGGWTVEREAAHQANVRTAHAMDRQIEIGLTDLKKVGVGGHQLMVFRQKAAAMTTVADRETLLAAMAAAHGDRLAAIGQMSRGRRLLPGWAGGVTGYANHLVKANHPAVTPSGIDVETLAQAFARAEIILREKGGR